MITPKQIKAARLFLDWEQKDLADASGVSLPTIQRMEKLGIERSSVANADKVRRAIEDAGIEFLPGNGKGPGVRQSHTPPTVLRWPTKANKAKGELPFQVDYRGREFFMFVPTASLDKLAGAAPSGGQDYIDLFNQYRARILSACARAIEAGRADAGGHLHLGPEDFSGR